MMEVDRSCGLSMPLMFGGEDEDVPGAASPDQVVCRRAARLI